MYFLLDFGPLFRSKWAVVSLHGSSEVLPRMHFNCALSSEWCFIQCCFDKYRLGKYSLFTAKCIYCGIWLRTQWGLLSHLLCQHWSRLLLTAAKCGCRFVRCDALGRAFMVFLRSRKQKKTMVPTQQMCPEMFACQASLIFLPYLRLLAPQQLWFFLPCVCFP